MTPSSSGYDGTTYAKTPTWDGRRVPRWYVEVTSSLGMRTVPWTDQPPILIGGYGRDIFQNASTPGDLPVNGVIENQHELIGLCQKVEDEARSMMWLEERCNAGKLNIPRKYLHRVYGGDKYA